MAKDEDLDLTVARFPFGAGEPQQPAQDQVQDREEHPRMLRNRCDGARSESFRPFTRTRGSRRSVRRSSVTNLVMRPEGRGSPPPSTQTTVAAEVGAR
jgi:hypothetical protein